MSRTTYRQRSEERADDQCQIQFRTTSELRERLHSESARRLVSLNYLIERALEEALARWEKQKLP